MEILRRPPFPLIVSYSELLSERPYVMTVHTQYNDLVTEIETESTTGGVAEFELDETFNAYDAEYSVVVYDGTIDDKGSVVVLDTLRVVRPYVDAAAMAPVGQEDTYRKYERIARTMIDNVVGGFYFQKVTIRARGMGSDTLPLGMRVNKVLSVTENKVVTYDSNEVDNIAEYELTTSGTSLAMVTSIDSPLFGDSTPFPRYYNYVVTVENGWPAVPQDIKEATTLLIEDMASGIPNYWSKYVRNYQTNDFKVDFQRMMFDGTGNLLVDQILLRYQGDTIFNNIRVL